MAPLPANSGVPVTEHPSWIDEVSGWVVTFSEAGRFGMCRIVLFFGEETASVAMPDPEYTRISRALDVGPGDLAELWRHGLLPTERPGANSCAPLLKKDEPR
jgi:hypothetical protein